MTSSNHSDAPSADPASISYADAAAELDRILAALDGDHVDVDVLAAHVERAAVLITVCRDRISAARIHVERAVAGLAATTAPTGPGDRELGPDDHDEDPDDEPDDDADEVRDEVGGGDDELDHVGLGRSDDSIVADARGDDAAP